MAMKMDRRSFLKTSAAVAVAVTMALIWVALRLLWANGAPSLMIRV